MAAGADRGGLWATSVSAEPEPIGKLEHPNIVRAMDAGEVDGTHYLVMEFVDGTDLAKLVEKRGPRSVLETCEMLRQAALGLAHAVWTDSRLRISDGCSGVRR